MGPPPVHPAPALDLRTWRGHNSERAIRWLIALMVMCCDPLAIALTADGFGPPMEGWRGRAVLPRYPVRVTLAEFPKEATHAIERLEFRIPKERRDPSDP